MNKWTLIELNIKQFGFNALTETMIEEQAIPPPL
jgi:hypothetical protein